MFITAYEMSLSVKPFTELLFFTLSALFYAWVLLSYCHVYFISVVG